MSPLPATRDRYFWTAIAFSTLLAGLAAFATLAMLDNDDNDAALSTEANPLDLTPADVSDGLAAAEVLGFDGSSRTFAEAVDTGTPTVVNFFASTCAPCRFEMPDFEEVSNETKGEVHFLGLAMQDQPEDALNTVEETGVTYEVARDQRGDILAAVGGVVMPTTAFVGADGTVLDVHSGELTADELRTKIDELFGL